MLKYWQEDLCLKGLLTSNSVNVLDNKFKDGIFDYSHDELGETIASIKEIESNLSALTFSYFNIT